VCESRGCTSIVPLTAAGHGTAEIMQATGKAKTVIWRWSGFPAAPPFANRPASRKGASSFPDPGILQWQTWM
jgi:hypothetical protein